MAKKATLLKRALKLKLDVTEKSTVPEIQAALDAHAAKTATGNGATGTPTNPPAPAPETEETPTMPVEDETAVQSVSEPQINLKDILMIYNSVTPSRRRWIQNRNALRNTWKEFFQILEIASGRSGQKAEILDYNWHKIIDKGGEPGLGNLERDKIKIVVDESATVTNTTAKDHKILELQAEIDRLNEEIRAITDANTGVQADNTAGEVPTNRVKHLGDDEALPGEKSTLDEGSDESKTSQEAGKTPETEETTTTPTE